MATSLEVKAVKPRTTRNSRESEIIPPLDKEPRRQRAPPKPKVLVDPELETIDEPRTPVASYSSRPAIEGSPGVEELVNQFAERISELPDNWQQVINDDLLESLFSEAPEFDANEEFPLVNYKEVKVSCEVLFAVITLIRSAEAQKFYHVAKRELGLGYEERFDDEGYPLHPLQPVNTTVEEARKLAEFLAKLRAGQIQSESSDSEYLSAEEEELAARMSGNTNGGGRRVESMPSRTARGAPSFEPSKPEELERYFDDLEEWFVRAGLTSDAAKRPYIGKYAPLSTELEWKNIEGWNTKSYDDIKEAIMKEYPAAIAMKNGSIEKLNQICRENQRIGENDLTKLLNFKRAFLVEAKKLQEAPSLLANHTLVAAFAKCLTAEFRERVYAKLDLTHSTDRLMDAWAQRNSVAITAPPATAELRPEDRFKLDEVVKTAEEMARIRNPGSTLTQTRGEVGVDFTVEQIRVKQEPTELGPLKQEIADIKNTVMNIKDAWVLQLREQAQLQEQSTRKLFEEFKNSVYNTSAPAAQPSAATAPMRTYTPMVAPRQFAPRQPSMSNTCHYCQSPTHFADACPFRKAHLDAGKVVRHPITGRLTLPDRSVIPFDEFKSTKDRVEEWHAKNKADKALASMQGIAPGVPRIYSQNQQMMGNRAAVRDVRDEEIDRLLAEVAHYRASSLQKVNVQQQESMQYQQTYEDYLRDERESTEASLQGLDSDYPQGFD